MSIIMAAESWLLSQPSLLYTKTKCPIISNSVKPFKLQNPSSCNNNSSTFSLSLPLTTRRGTRHGHSSFLTFAVDKFGNSEDSYKNLNFFISNLPDGLKLGTLFMLFEQVGTVNGASLDLGDVVGDQSFASVTMSMSKVEEVEEAINKFNGYELNGKLLTVSREKPIREPPKPRPRPPRPAFDGHFHISVTNLPKDVDSGRLEEIFSKYGSVWNVETVYNKQLDESTGSLTMINRTEMNNAFAALDGQSLNGNVIRLFFKMRE